jgi:hypothetical protein
VHHSADECYIGVPDPGEVPFRIAVVAKLHESIIPTFSQASDRAPQTVLIQTSRKETSDMWVVTGTDRAER